MNKTPEEILIEKYGCFNLADLQKCFLNDMISFSMIRESMQEYGKQQYNQAIKDAAENAEVKKEATKLNMYSTFDWESKIIIDKDSILKLLKP